MEKFKEKKPQVVQALQEAIDAAFLSVSTEYFSVGSTSIDPLEGNVELCIAVHVVQTCVLANASGHGSECNVLISTALQIISHVLQLLSRHQLSVSVRKRTQFITDFRFCWRW